MINRYDDLKIENEAGYDSYLENIFKIIKDHVGDSGVLLGLSGGVDSSVCAALLATVLPGKVHCIFVDHGLMRKNEGDEVEKAFKNFELNIVRVNAEERFLDKLAGIIEPEEKRKIIGHEFIRLFEEEASKLAGVEYLAQGTIFADVSESGKDGKALIKSHHNVGGLPQNMNFKGIVEPFRSLTKSQVRVLGCKLGLPSSLTDRPPFPGPGLAVRCIGELTKDRLDTLREVDSIFCKELEAAGFKADQYFAVLTNLNTVGIKNDAREYGSVVALRAVSTEDFMTAGFCKIPYELLDKVSQRITTEVPGICRVVYDITSKPPSTIEWE